MTAVLLDAFRLFVYCGLFIAVTFVIAVGIGRFLRLTDDGQVGRIQDRYDRPPRT
jgi:hypothetical protein